MTRNSTCPECHHRLCLHPDTGLCWPCTDEPIRCSESTLNDEGTKK